MSTEETTEQIPRRIDHSRHTAAEEAITDAMQLVERAGCDVALTDAVVLLEAARTRVADFVDGVPGVRVQVSLYREYTGDPLTGQLATLLNRYSAENGSATPDFILAEYLLGCLKVFDATMAARSKWYGREDTPGVR